MRFGQPAAASEREGTGESRLFGGIRFRAAPTLQGYASLKLLTRKVCAPRAILAIHIASLPSHLIIPSPADTEAEFGRTG